MKKKISWCNNGYVLLQWPAMKTEENLKGDLYKEI
jgi:hypothetical protein